MTTLAVSTTSPAMQLEAEKLAASLHLAFIELEAPLAKTYNYLLLLTPDFIGLQKTSDKKHTPFYIDFLSGKMRHRTQQAGIRKELLARAMGLKPHDHPLILDATAGLGRDSFMLATLGFSISMLERSPILHTLLADALARAQKNPGLEPTLARMQLTHADALSWLKQASLTPPVADIIYLDPMFPARQKSASVKKEMVILQELLGKDEDAETLFKLAISCATRRVVVKRPRLAPTITEQLPSFSLLGKSSRFDVYLTLK
jgi:16S rRNA (guanine1516-N2)-methyltransferase